MFSFLEAIGDGLRQFFGQNGGFFSLPLFLAQVGNTNERHLLLIHALRECNESVLSARGVVITLQRWSGASQNDYAFFDLRAHDCDVTRLIPWRFLLFVSCFVFFVDNDEPEVLQRREHRAARADPDPGANPYLAYAALLMAGIDGIENKIHPGDPMDKDLYALPPEELKEVPQVCGSLRQALGELDADRDFLKAGGVFDDDAIDAYIDLKMEEVIRFEHTPHPVEFKMYYSV